ncbi:MAG: redox-sensing transcriptional repressor Rex [Ruminococcaceae bacterium]|nr:redox-sensing transcriptional repressor Rex [Oscillospiraceae bacterium]
MNNQKKVSEAVIRRLPRYYRYLGDLLNSGITRISSKDLSELMGTTASQIRQDLNCFGGFGQQGYGYNVEYLYKEIGNILGTDRENSVVILGAGNLGKAIANYTNFKRRGFSIKAIFDNNKNLIGTKINSIKVLDIKSLKDFLDTNSIDIVVLTIPAAGIKEVIDTVVNSKVKGIWNFSYLDLKVPDNIAMVNVHLSDSLMTLSYKINELNKE